MIGTLILIAVIVIYLVRTSGRSYGGKSSGGGGIVGDIVEGIIDAFD